MGEPPDPFSHHHAGRDLRRHRQDKDDFAEPVEGGDFSTVREPSRRSIGRVHLETHPPLLVAQLLLFVE